jgi:hypothetical protein
MSLEGQSSLVGFYWEVKHHGIVCVDWYGLVPDNQLFIGSLVVGTSADVHARISYVEIMPPHRQENEIVWIIFSKLNQEESNDVIIFVA